MSAPLVTTDHLQTPSEHTAEPREPQPDQTTSNYQHSSLTPKLTTYKKASLRHQSAHNIYNM